MNEIGVYCKSDFLFRKIELALEDVTVCRRMKNDECGGDSALFIIENGGTPSDTPSVITMSREEGADLSIPFTVTDIRQRVTARLSEGPALTLDRERSSAILHGEVIRLTELEFSLLELFTLAGDGFVSKEEILGKLWGEGVDAGVVNVYVHYLREKLEKHGERVIISSRGQGYKIDKSFLKEGK